MKIIFRLTYSVIILSCSLFLYTCQNTTKNNSSFDADKELLILKQGGLEPNVIEVDLEYFGMMCPCPQWATPQNVKLYNRSVKNGNPIPMDSLFMLVWPKNDSLINPFELDGWDKEGNRNIFRFRGHFYKKKYKWKGEDGIEWNCKVLKYSSCEVKF